MTIAYAVAGDLTQARSFLEDLFSLSAQANEPEIRADLACGACNLVISLVRSGDLEQASLLYDRIVALAGRYSEEPALRQWQAKGAINLSVGYGENRELVKARAVYDAVVALASAHADEPALRELQGICGHNMLILWPRRCAARSVGILRGAWASRGSAQR